MLVSWHQREMARSLITSILDTSMLPCSSKLSLHFMSLSLGPKGLKELHSTRTNRNRLPPMSSTLKWTTSPQLQRPLFLVHDTDVSARAHYQVVWAQVTPKQVAPKPRERLSVWEGHCLLFFSCGLFYILLLGLSMLDFVALWALAFGFWSGGLLWLLLPPFDESATRTPSVHHHRFASLGILPYHQEAGTQNRLPSPQQQDIGELKHIKTSSTWVRMNWWTPYYLSALSS